MLKEGLIVKINSDTFTVKIGDNYLDTKSRGKFREQKIKPLVGDHVKVNEEEKVIEEIGPRKNALDRPLVANIDIALIVTSLKRPDLNLTLLDKLISIITIKKIKPVIVLTKLDLVDSKKLKELSKVFNYYEKIGIPVFTNQKWKKLKKFLKGKIVTVCGQTGAGKSTLINYFDPTLNLKTDEISLSLNRGKHTTRIVELFPLDDFYIVDTPGFSAISLENYSEEEIRNSFNELVNAHCKFKDCNHIKTKDCKVIAQLNKGLILESRYENYQRFLKEVK